MEVEMKIYPSAAGSLIAHIREREDIMAMTEMKYTLPTSSPWIVTIDGEQHVVPSTVCRLLLQLDKAAKEKKSTKPQKPSQK